MCVESNSLSNSRHTVSHVQCVRVVKRAEQTGILNICCWCGQSSKQLVCQRTPLALASLA